MRRRVACAGAPGYWCAGVWHVLVRRGAGTLVCAGTSAGAWCAGGCLVHWRVPGAPAGAGALACAGVLTCAGALAGAGTRWRVLAR